MATFQFLLDCPREKGTVIPPHFHDYYELVCYYGGKGHSDYRPADKMPYKRGEFLTFYERPFSSNGSFRFDDNSIILYKPYTIHNEVHEKDCNVIAFGFTLNRDVKLDNAIFHSPSHEISDTIAAIRREYNEKKNNFELAADGLIDVLLCELTRLDSASAKSATSPLHYVKIYLDNYYMTDVTVTELAAMARFSPDHFCRLFIREYGVAPKEYLLRLRLGEAEKLLADTDLPVSAIATQVGFSDISQFSWFYKKRHGFPPSQARK